MRIMIDLEYVFRDSDGNYHNAQFDNVPLDLGLSVNEVEMLYEDEFEEHVQSIIWERSRTYFEEVDDA